MAIWNLVKEAMGAIVEQSGNPVVAEKQIREYILANDGTVNPASITNQIMFCTVNRQARVNGPENQRSSMCNRGYDFLFRPNLNVPEVVFYNPDTHGQWEICQADDLKFSVRKTDEEAIASSHSTEQDSEANTDFAFAFESHLRDFISRNLFLLGNLTLYENGVEYVTDVGRIDVLAQNEIHEFVVIELKLSRGEDAALGQTQRYMGWIKENLSENNVVHGIIIAKSISKKLKYAVSVAQNISLFEYSMHFDVSSVCL